MYSKEKFKEKLDYIIKHFDINLSAIIDGFDSILNRAPINNQDYSKLYYYILEYSASGDNLLSFLSDLRDSMK